jgi:predicted nucleotidyltransferase
MTRDEVLSTLRANEGDLRARGVRHAALFGSLARGQAMPGSDIDVFVDIDPAASIDLFQYIAIAQFIADLFTETVDVADRHTLKAPVRTSAERDAIYAF